MLDNVDKILKMRDRTPAWLCRQAGVHRCNYSLIKKGQQKLSSNLMDKFSKILGISKDVLFPNNNQESK
jgi:plasmid maintenance system antidote protein VapI|tara:strand:- start:724 stop:930 length:207 start_codon:yes stop_codon:yes gene_type:complete